MQINEIHDFIEFVLDKEAGGSNTHPEIDYALFRGSLGKFKQDLGYYAETQKFQDSLAPFKTQYIFTNSTSTSGIVRMPSNYEHFLSLWTLQFDNDLGESVLKEVSFVNDDDWAERRRSQLDPIKDNPIARWIGKGKFQVAPEKACAGETWYLKTPVHPKYAYTQTGRLITYDSVNSIQMEWNETELDNVMFRALQILGVNLSQEQMVQYTQLKLQDA